jgi:hypothetical protein
VLVAGCTGTHSAKKAARAELGTGANPTAAASSAGAGSAPDKRSTTPKLPDRALARTASLTVRVADVSAQAGRAVRIVTAAGGSVLADQRSGSGVHATADLTVEVPPDTLETELDELAALGDQVDRTTSTDDVTQQVVDVTARLISLRASLNRVRTLYARANTIADVIRLESELTNRQADLEALETQQHDLARRTARATITVHLRARRAVAPPPAPKHHGGVGRGFSAGWTVTAFGAVLPFLAVAAAGVSMALWWRRRARGPSKPASTPTSGPAEG